MGHGKKQKHKNKNKQKTKQKTKTKLGVIKIKVSMKQPQILQNANFLCYTCQWVTGLQHVSLTFYLQEGGGIKFVIIQKGRGHKNIAKVLLDIYSWPPYSTENGGSLPVCSRDLCHKRGWRIGLMSWWRGHLSIRVQVPSLNWWSVGSFWGRWIWRRHRGWVWVPHRHSSR